MGTMIMTATIIVNTDPDWCISQTMMMLMEVMVMIMMVAIADTDPDL